MLSQTQAVRAVGRQLQALELRKAGVPYNQIATRLGYSGANSAHKAVKSALKKTLQEPADAVRAIEVERMDAMLSAIWRQVRQGNHGAIDRALRIMERRARLLGLDAPGRTDITSAGDPVIIKVILRGHENSGGGIADAASGTGASAE